MLEYKFWSGMVLGAEWFRICYKEVECNEIIGQRNQYWLPADCTNHHIL
jgi:hypothetical protein